MHIVVLVVVVLCVASHTCSGEDKDTGKRFIVGGTYSWGPWTQYSDCQPTCPGGTKYRSRSCFEKIKGWSTPDFSNCNGGPSKQSVQCNLSDCISVSTACVDTSSDCQRYDKSKYCQDPYIRWAKANCAKYCGFCTAGSTLHGVWSHWSGWSSCTRTCGSGTRFRTRICNGPEACQGDNRQMQQCYHHCQPVVNGLWGHWSPYSACTHACGPGTSTRYRICNNPAPSGGGHQCSGTYIDKIACNLRSCKVDGAWGGWGSWTDCSASCDLGTITRIRQCNNPVPQGGGNPCAGDNKESHECSKGPCPAWSHWFEGSCSVSCGNGTVERLRHCSTGRDSDCGGKAYELVPCSEVTCV